MRVCVGVGGGGECAVIGRSVCLCVCVCVSV